jgi:2-polyprenyl-3-methyl-5-hydroxy-6-metoxy-1,4-benzoquinol methylase
VPLNAAWLGVVTITVAGIASVVGPARLWADQTITVGSTFQRLLEIGIIGLVIGMLIGSRPDVTRSAWSIDSSLLDQLIITGIRMSAMSVLLVTGRNLAGFLTSALLCGILAMAMPALMKTDEPAAVLSLEILHWGILALAAAYRASPAPQQPAGYRMFDRDDVWRGAVFARFTLVSGLAGAVFWLAASRSFVIGLVLLAVAYEGCLHLRHQELQRRRRTFVRRERAAVHEAQQRDQQLIQSLARLIHDLGPPVQGVSSIADLLLRIAAREARESPGTISERLGRHAEDGPYNAHYDRPALLGLLPPVDGLHVLDAGCGPGLYAAWLVAQEATVVGLDISPRMVALAKTRLGERATILEADLAQPLTMLADASFDLVISGLALDYVPDWAPLFREGRGAPLPPTAPGHAHAAAGSGFCLGTAA